MVIFNSYIIHNQVGTRPNFRLSHWSIDPVVVPLWSQWSQWFLFGFQGGRQRWCSNSGLNVVIALENSAATTVWEYVMERTEGEAVEWCGMFFSTNKDGMAHATMIHNVGLAVDRWNTVLSASFWLGELPSDMDFSRCKYWVLCVQQGFAYAEAVEVRAQACLPGA